MSGILDGRWETGPLIAVQGVEDCTDPRCAHRYDEDGQVVPGCMSYHCPLCGKATSMYGCFKTGRYIGGEYYGFADGEGAFSCQPGFDEIPLAPPPSSTGKGA